MESSYTDSDIVSLSSHGSITPARQEPATAAPTLPLSLDDCFLQLSAAFARARLETPQDKEVKRKYRAFTAFEETFMEQEGEEEVAVAVGDKELEVARSEVCSGSEEQRVGKLTLDHLGLHRRCKRLSITLERRRRQRKRRRRCVNKFAVAVPYARGQAYSLTLSSALTTSGSKLFETRTT